MTNSSATTSALEQAAIRGLTTAGFVNVRAITREARYFEGIELAVQGDCPCGLGTSGFALMLPHVEGLNGGLPVIANHVEQTLCWQGKAHIEKDREAGRWVD